MNKKLLPVVVTISLVLSLFLAIPAGANAVHPPPVPEELWSYNTTWDVTDVAVGDLNGDHKEDVVAIEAMIDTYTLTAIAGDDGTMMWDHPFMSGFAVAVGDINTESPGKEVIAGGWNNTAHVLNAYRGNGTLLWSRIVYQSVKDIEIGDIDNDGIDDVVACTSSAASYIYAFNGTGHDLPGWPVYPSSDVIDLAIGQLDGLGGVDVAAIGDYYAGCLYVYNSTGGLMWSDLNIVGRAVEIGDVDGHGDNEVVAVTYDSEYAYDGGGTPTPTPSPTPTPARGGWVLAFDGDEGGLPLYSFYTEDYAEVTDVELGDLDGNPEDVEVAAITGLIPATLFAIDIDSPPAEREMWNYPIDWNTWYYGESLAIGDVDRDYRNEVIAAGEELDHIAMSRTPDSCFYGIYAFDGIDRDDDGQGDLVWSPFCVDQTPITDVEVGDLDGDGDDDVAFGTTTFCIHAITAVESKTVTATGTGTAYFDSDPSILEGLTALAESELPEEGKPNIEFPHGFFSFNITLPPGHTTAIVTMTFPSPLPVGTQYWKYHEPEGWIDVTSLLGDDDGDYVLTLTLTDGGLGDDDGMQNGVIVDQGGPGIPVAQPPVGGEAYPVSKASLLAPWIAVGVVLAGGISWYILRRRRAQS